jgi:cytochrome P450
MPAMARTAAAASLKKTKEPDQAPTCPIDRHDWDPTAPETQADPFTTHARLRAQCPVAHSNNWGGFFTLTKYEDILTATADRENFSAVPYTVIPSSPKKNLLPRYPLQVDPPAHTTYRRALNPYFTQPKVDQLELQARVIARELLRPLVAKGRADIATEYNEQYSVRMLCAFVGLAPEEGEELKHLSFDYIRAIQTQDMAKASTLSKAVDAYAVNLVEQRKAHPRDIKTDMTSGLLAKRVDGKPFTDIEVAGMIRILLIGGHTVTTNFLGSAVRHLADDQELQQKLRRDPALIAPAVEELLRFYSPNQALVRTTTKDVEIRGQTVPAHQPVAMLYISGNRDSDIFDHPDEFDLERTPNKHIAFGHGIHKCIGQALARMEARVALEQLLAGTALFTREGPYVAAKWPEYGIASMTLRLTPQS